MSYVTTYHMKRHTNPNEFPELILQRLALNPELLEQSTSIKGLTRYQISRGFYSDDRIIPQSTILNCTKELEADGYIRPLSKSRLATRKYKITYDLTVAGLIRWFYYLDKNWKELKKLDTKRIKMAIERSQRLLPFISDNWSKLKEIFKDENIIIMMLLWASDIEIHNYSDSKSTGSFASALINVGGFKIQVTNEIEIPISKRLETITISDAIDRNLGELFTFVYIYRLETQAQDRKAYYENRKKIFSLIKSDPSTYDAYLKFIKQLKVLLGKAADHMKDIEITLEGNN